MEAAEPKQSKRVYDIISQIDEFQKDPCEGVWQMAAATSLGATTPSIPDLDAYIAPPKLHNLPLVSPESYAKRVSSGSRKEKELVLRVPKNERTASKRPRQ